MNNLWQFRTRNIFTLTIICFSFLVVGVFISLSNNLQFIARQISQNMAVVFFLEKDISSERIQELEKTLEASPLVLRVAYVSAEDAMVKFRDRFPDLQPIVENLKANPFPPSFEVTLERNVVSSPDASVFIGRILDLPGIEDAQYNQQWVERMQSFSRLVRAVGFFLGGILILASFLIISNVIKLNVLARQEEIEILRMTGASNLFIRIPFLMEGITLGFLGGTVSLLLLAILIRLLPLYLGSSLGALNELINFRTLTFSQSILMLLVSAFIGFFGSLSSLARFLKT